MAVDFDTKKIDNYEEALKKVKEDGLNYFEISDDLKSNINIICEAIKENYYVYNFLDDNIKENMQVKSIYLKSQEKVENALKYDKKKMEIINKLYNFEYNYLEKKYSTDNDDMISSLGKQISLNKIANDFYDFVNSIDFSSYDYDSVKDIIDKIKEVNMFVSDNMTDVQKKHIEQLMKGIINNKKINLTKKLTNDLFKTQKQIDELNKRKNSILNSLSKLSGGISNKL